MRVVRCPTKCSRKLAAGEIRRVPAPPGYLAGYHVGCPGCGVPTGHSAVDVTFSEEGESLSMTDWTCTHCGVRFFIEKDEIHVRPAL